MNLLITLTDKSKQDAIIKYLKRNSGVKKIVAIDSEGNQEVKFSNREMVNSMFKMSSSVISKSLSRK